jgi:HK97 gp10 family phage protein|tara:strand:+ start:367 stop:777 length:411 start_codon:yes stop_codon:yes gene_type:complete
MTGIKTRVTRAPKYAKVEAKYASVVKNIIASGVQDTMNTAKTSIQQHQSKGRTYGKHTASVAGNPPNSDTGFLANNIFMVLDADKFGGAVESRADYSGFLEFGTSKMGARPYLQPALEENRPKIRRMFARLRSRGV